MEDKIVTKAPSAVKPAPTVLDPTRQPAGLGVTLMDMAGRSPTVILVASGPGENGEAWQAALADPTWRTRATLLKLDGGDSVKRVTLHVDDHARDVIIKRRVVADLWDRLKVRLGQGRLARQFRGSMLLARHGIAAAAPVAVLRAHGSFDYTTRDADEELLVLHVVPGRSVLEHLSRRDLSPSREHAAAEAIGAQVAAILALGRYNRDHKPSNLIVTNAHAGELGITVLDTVAIRRIRHGSEDAAARMLASLAIEAIGCGCPPRRSLQARAIARLAKAMRVAEGYHDPLSKGSRHERMRALWRRAAARVAAHRDKRPAVDPLAPPANATRADAEGGT